MRPLIRRLWPNRLKPPTRKQPGVLIIGAQKAGTSALFDMLALHPALLPSTRKEIHFFDKEENYAKGMDHYRSQFPVMTDQNTASVAYEATPAYLFYAEKTAPRIKAHLPDAVCLAILRDPVKRAYSAWNMFRACEHHPRSSHLYDPRSFAQAVDDEITGKPVNIAHRYLLRGNYATQIAHFKAAFPEEQLLIRSYVDLKRDPDAFVGDLCKHLRLSPMPERVRLKQIRTNTKRYSEPLDIGLAAELYQYFAPEMLKLRTVLGYDLDILETNG